MFAKAAFPSVVLLAFGLAGCGQQNPQPKIAWESVEWKTYTSPDGHVSFEHPAELRLTVRPRSEADDPQLALFMESSDLSLGGTLVLRISDEPMPDYCDWLMDSCTGSGSRAVSERVEISADATKGVRQEFREGMGRLAQEFIAVALEAQPAYVHFTAAYNVSDKEALRPICERMARSLKLNQP
jgi:hypothetical protein